MTVQCTCPEQIQDSCISLGNSLENACISLRKGCEGRSVMFCRGLAHAVTCTGQLAKCALKISCLCPCYMCCYSKLNKTTAHRYSLCGVARDGVVALGHGNAIVESAFAVIFGPTQGQLDLLYKSNQEELERKGIEENICCYNNENPCGDLCYGYYHDKTRPGQYFVPNDEMPLTELASNRLDCSHFSKHRFPTVRNFAEKCCRNTEQQSVVIFQGPSHQLME